MLGSAVASETVESGLETIVTAREPTRLAPAIRRRERFDALQDDPLRLAGGLRQGDVILNCVGVIRHLMRDDDRQDRVRAIAVNAMFPHRLASAAESTGARVVQIATDCVFAGDRGSYAESDAHDADDVYGQTKSLGEVPSDAVLNVRCSIIGPEASSSTSLQEWVLSHPPGSELTGYTDHIWNGVTTAVFARVAVALAARDWVGGTHHLVPRDVVTKAELCGLILKTYGRDDVLVRPVKSAKSIDRSLVTVNPEWNSETWSAAGWMTPPTIAEMIEQSRPASSLRREESYD